MSMADVEKAAVASWERSIAQATEQIQKRQYLNALVHVHHAGLALLTAFSSVLKRGDALDQQMASYCKQQGHQWLHSRRADQTKPRWVCMTCHAERPTEAGKPGAWAADYADDD